MRQWRPTTIKPPTNVHPVVRLIYEQMRLQQVGYCDLADRSGVDRHTLRAWRTRNDPSLGNLAAVLGALGFEVTVRRIVDPD